MSADTLTTTSRSFYERAKSKLTISIIISGVALLLLGFTSSAGGQAQAAADSNGDDEVNKALSAGYGFGAFCFILSFFLFLAAAVYVSPLFCGSPNEKKMIRAPQEIDTNYAAYSDGAKGSAPPV